MTLFLEGALAGAGYTFWPMIWSSSLTWLAISITAVLRGVMMIVLWLRGDWRHRTV